jgi:hypothetical protein
MIPAKMTRPRVQPDMIPAKMARKHEIPAQMNHRTERFGEI